MGTLTRSLLALVIMAAFTACFVPAASADSDEPGPFVTGIIEPTTEPTIEETITVGGGKGWIDTYCNVDGASVYYDSVLKGRIAGGILSVAVTPTATPINTITVVKGGYTSWTGPLPHMPADKQHVSVYATINPLTTIPTTIGPQTGAIYAKSSPGGAAIYVNGIHYGNSPVTIPSLQPATYSVKAVLSGYTADSQLITVYGGQTASYYPQLKQSPPSPRATGTVYLKSSPPGAQAYVDGEYRGQTPVTVTLFTGTHSVLVRLPGYNDWSSTISVSADSTQTVSPTMSTATAGMLTIGSAPAGATVYLDSNSQGITDSGGTLIISDLVSGNHVVKVTATGYNDWIETVFVKPNTNNYVQVSMTPSGSAPGKASGTVEIASSPAGADVFIDNIFRGYSPVTLKEIDAGQHTLTLKYSGYQDYVSTISVSAGQSVPVAVTMTPAPTQTPESGLTLLLPAGGILTMIALVSLSRRRT